MVDFIINNSGGNYTKDKKDMGNLFASFEDLINAMDEDEIIDIVSNKNIPSNHWVAGTLVLGIKRYYILEGEVFDPESIIKGRLEQYENYWIGYEGSVVLGGEIAAVHDLNKAIKKFSQKTLVA